MKLSILSNKNIVFCTFVWFTISGLHASGEYEMEYDDVEWVSNEWVSNEWVSNEFFESISGEFFEFEEGSFGEEGEYASILMSELASLEEKQSEKVESEQKREHYSKEKKSEPRSQKKSKKSQSKSRRPQRENHRTKPQEEGLNTLSTKGLVGFYFYVLRDIAQNAAGVGVKTRLGVIDQTLDRFKWEQDILDKKTLKTFCVGLKTLAKNVGKMKQNAHKKQDEVRMKKLKSKTLRTAKKLKKVVSIIEQQ